MSKAIDPKHLRLVAISLDGESKALIRRAVLAKLETLDVPRVNIRAFEARREGEPSSITWSAGNLLEWIRSVDDTYGKVLLMQLAATLEFGPSQKVAPKGRDSLLAEGVSVVSPVRLPGFEVPTREPVAESEPAAEPQADTPASEAPAAEPQAPEPAAEPSSNESGDEGASSPAGPPQPEG
jgi:hypothetical protein